MIKMQKEKIDLLNDPMSNTYDDFDAESDWLAVDKDNIESLRAYLNTWPDSPHAREARKIINRKLRDDLENFDINALVGKVGQAFVSGDDPFDIITREVNRKRVSMQEVLGVLANDHNFLDSYTVQRLIEEGYIEYKDLEDAGIDPRFICYLAGKVHLQSFADPDPIERINKVCTEVYFWGIPSSGKSCALGSILSVAANGTVARTMVKDNNCQGYGYMHRLSQIVPADGKVGSLIEGTAVKSTYEMGFDLEDSNRRVHPITCIDLAGELVRCMYKSDAHEPLTADQEEALATLTRILIDNRSVNRKVHFFVLEYGGENRLYEGLTQKEYLDGALRYIERTGIFRKDTDAIYLMFTKVDKTGLTGRALVEKLMEYTDTHYRGFFNGLEKICRDFEINGGRVERIPFSIGEVCFQDYCLFDSRWAENVVKIILNRSKGFRSGKIGGLLGKLKG